MIAYRALYEAIANFNANLNHVGSIAWRDLSTALTHYEASGDHDHSTRGNRPIKVGERCPGGDCLVYVARRALYESLGRSLGVRE